MYYNLDKNGWVKSIYNGIKTDREDMKNKGIYWSNIVTIWDSELDKPVEAYQRLKLVNDQLILQSEDDYNDYQQQLKNERAMNISQCTKIEVHQAMIQLGLEQIFNQFKSLPFYEDTIYFNMNHPSVQDGLKLLPQGTQLAIKLKILGYRQK